MHDDRIRELIGSSSRGPSGAGVDDAIVVDDLAKRYPNGTEAVRGVSFRVFTGEVFGLLGPNGAGKSTTMGMLGTLVRPTGGRATVAGHDVVEAPRQVRRSLGFAMQEVGVDDLATGTELLVLHGRAAIWAALDRFKAELGMTILMTTHFMEEADRLCDRIAIVDHGRIVVEGTPEELKGQIGAADVVTLVDVYLHSTGRELEVAA